MPQEQMNTTVLDADDTGDERLLREYHWLTDGAMLGLLTAEQQARMQQVQNLLNARDAVSPAAVAMRQQMDTIRQRLDSLEAQINQLPDA